MLAERVLTPAAIAAGFKTDVLPLIAYASDRFEREVRSMIDLVENQPVEGGFAAWGEFADWGT